MQGTLSRCRSIASACAGPMRVTICAIKPVMYQLESRDKRR